MYKILNCSKLEWPDDTCLMNDACDIIEPKSVSFDMKLKARRIAFLTIAVGVPKKFVSQQRSRQIKFSFFSRE